ncbi:hypothetical protein ACQUW5_07810 [Legionella sp. CNM-1927-20]
MPAQAGIHSASYIDSKSSLEDYSLKFAVLFIIPMVLEHQWIPAYAGMTS